MDSQLGREVHPTGVAPGVRPGAFARVRARWLPVWAIGGTLVLMVVAELIDLVTPSGFSEDLLGVLLYLPVIAWVLLVVVRRNGVDLLALLRWPRLGSYWWVVSGLFAVQLLFSVGAVSLTDLAFPGLTDSLEGVGEGNLVLSLLGLAILPPLVEEVVFRGVLIERFAVKWRTGVAVVVSALAFGILHVDPVGAGVFGVMTGLLYLRTGSLWPAILIHLANNLVALVAVRSAPADAAAAEPTTSEVLTTAAVSLALSVPLLVWFIVRTWPLTREPTPYQRFEAGWAGVVPVAFPDVLWSAAPGPVRVVVTPTHLIVDRPIPGQPDLAAKPIAVVHIEQVAAAYPTDVPGGKAVVVLLGDGSWTTFSLPGGAPGPTTELALAIAERAPAGRATSPP